MLMKIQDWGSLGTHPCYEHHKGKGHCPTCNGIVLLSDYTLCPNPQCENGLVPLEGAKVERETQSSDPKPSGKGKATGRVRRSNQTRKQGTRQAKPANARNPNRSNVHMSGDRRDLVGV